MSEIDYHKQLTEDIRILVKSLKEKKADIAKVVSLPSAHILLLESGFTKIYATGILSRIKNDLREWIKANAVV